MRSGATKSVLNAFADSDRFHPPKSLGEIVAGCERLYRVANQEVLFLSVPD